jgi:hypothetical protein
LATAVLAPQRPALVRFLDRYFYFSMSLLIAAVVAWGFGHTVNQNLIHASPIPPFILTIHAIVFPGWVLFFILQSALVRSHNVKLHRTVGWFGVALAVAIVVVGFLTARGMDRFHLTQPDDSFNTRAFMIIQLTDLVCFAVPFALAIYWRRRPEYHRRSVLIASCALDERRVRPLPAYTADMVSGRSRLPHPPRRGPRLPREPSGAQGLSLRSPAVHRHRDPRRSDLHTRRSLVASHRRSALALDRPFLEEFGAAGGTARAPITRQVIGIRGSAFTNG